MTAYRVCCGILAFVASSGFPALALAAVNSPVSTGLLVGLDGASTLVDGTNKVKVWYDQVAGGGDQDFGQQSASLQPTLLTGFAMPNGTLHSVVDFTANQAGTTGSRIDSMSGVSSRITNFGDTFVSGPDAAYSNQSSLTWFAVFRSDTLPTGSSRGIFSADFDDPAGILDLQTNIQLASSTAKIRNLGRNATGSALGATTGLNTFDNAVGTNWFVAAIQYNAAASAVNGFGAQTMTVTALRQDGMSQSISGSVDGIYANHLLSSLGGLMNSTTSGLFDGKIAEFLYYNTVLSAADTSAVMTYLNNKYFPIQGDFDGDGDVDGADFIVWQTNYPKESGATLSQGNGDGDADVDGADFAVWQNHFPHAPSAGVAPVPEPSGVIMTAVSAIALTFAARRRRSQVRQG